MPTLTIIPGDHPFFATYERCFGFVPSRRRDLVGVMVARTYRRRTNEPTTLCSGDQQLVTIWWRFRTVSGSGIAEGSGEEVDLCRYAVC